MDSWEDVGGSDLWLHSDEMPNEHYDVYHASKQKRAVFTPNTIWTYQGKLNWLTDGTAPNAAPEVAPPEVAHPWRQAKAAPNASAKVSAAPKPQAAGKKRKAGQ